VLVLPDGKKVAATNIVTHVDADAITWQSKYTSILAAMSRGGCAALNGLR
jgi:hypothetical protein